MDVVEPHLGYAAFPTPIDTLHLVFAGESLVHVDFAGTDARMQRGLERRFGSWHPQPAPLPEAIAAPLEAYFAGDFGPVATLGFVTGGTEFQRRVWRALLAIPPGRTSTYGEIAEAVGKDRGASRAIGAAVGANPISIVIPCHRVVGAQGRMTGYAGGLERKRWLLRHEGLSLA